MASPGTTAADVTFTADHETFRNELASVARDGRRRWLYVRQPAGWLYRARTVVSLVLLAFLVVAPFVTVHGQPLMLLDVIERRFVLLGVVFWPQDFYLVVLIALVVLVTLVLSTAAIGRVWCGWLCPQTVFMEMVFRRIEYLLEGSAHQQVRRDRAPWTVATRFRNTVKHVIFFGLSFIIANVFLAWVIGADELRVIVTDPPQEHLVGLMSIVIFSFVFYGVFARFREQACILACPYGRVMSSLIDRDTITVTYDAGRGEPRGRMVKGRTATSEQATGDCIDCHQCVTVCPTGIDIRNGIQLECINCTSCIDACDEVMLRVGRPTGLIRLTSDRAVREGRTHWLTGRVKAYAAVWIVLIATAAGIFLNRRTLDVLILRQSGTLYTTTAAGDLANFYTVQAFNRTSHPTRFEIDVVHPKGAAILPLGKLDAVSPYSLLEGRLLLQVPPTAISGPTTRVQFVVRSNGQVVQEITSSFLGPGAVASPREPASN